MKNTIIKKSAINLNAVLCYFILLMASYTYGQVGVGNTNPQASLDITASNQATPSNVDGILIPRIDTFPLTSPTAAQNGMLVYLTTAVGSNPKGFYHWDQVNGWTKLSSIEKLNDLSDAKSDEDGSEDGSSIFIGIDAGANDDGNDRRNVGIGYRSLNANTDADHNSAFGYATLENNTTISGNSGNNNSAFGYVAMRENTTGQGNSAFGKRALETNTIANHNTAVGADALGKNNPETDNSGGNANTAIGNAALTSNTTGNENVALGNLALTTNVSGNYNTAIGTLSLTNNLIGSNNTAIGYNALKENISANNTAVGSLAGEFIAVDDNLSISNVMIGYLSGNALDGSHNVLVGQQSGRYLEGDSNVFLGRQAGRDNKGSSNVFIGNRAGFNGAWDLVSNTLVIQNESSATPLIYGNFSTGKVGIAKTASTHALEIEGTTEATQFKLSALNTAPASASDTGTEGEIRVTVDYIYICKATNTWVRAPLSTW